MKPIVGARVEEDGELGTIVGIGREDDDCGDVCLVTVMFDDGAIIMYEKDDWEDGHISSAPPLEPKYNHDA